MDQLWAGWRAKYVTNVDKQRCFFCAYPKQRADKKNLLVARGKLGCVVMNRYPYNVGHLLIAPYRHKGKLKDLTDAEILELNRLTVEMLDRLERAVRPHGFNIGVNLGRVAGAGLPGHFHIHIVPRWDGDTNFMPVVGKTKVMPVSLESLYDALKSRKRLKTRPRNSR